MVLGIVFIVSVAKIMKARMGIREDRWGNQSQASDDAETARLREETRTLKERVAVLEGLKPLGPALERGAEHVRRCLRSGNRLLAAGNGGSFADAAHFATEFVCRFQGDRRPFPAQVLGEPSALCAIGNDYDFADVFGRQVEAFGRPGDVLVVFSTSGRSENIRRALLAGTKQGLASIAFLGRDGGTCAGLASVELIVRTQSTARIQEAHKLLYHTLCELVEPSLKDW